MLGLEKIFGGRKGKGFSGFNFGNRHSNLNRAGRRREKSFIRRAKSIATRQQGVSNAEANRRVNESMREARLDEVRERTKRRNDVRKRIADKEGVHWSRIMLTSPVVGSDFPLYVIKGKRA